MSDYGIHLTVAPSQYNAQFHAFPGQYFGVLIPDTSAVHSVDSKIAIQYTVRMTNHRIAEGFEGQRLLVLPEKTSKHLRAHPLAAPLHVTDIGFFPCAYNHYRDRPLGSSDHIVVLCTDGIGWVKTGTAPKQSIQRGSWFLIPRNLPHSYGANSANPWSIYFFHMKGDYANTFAHYIIQNQSSYTALLPDQLMTRATSLIDEAYSTLMLGFTVNRLVLASQTIAHVLGLLGLTQASPVRDGNANLVTKTIEMMHINVERSLTLQELADNVNLSKTQFIRHFKTATGRSPIDYFLHLKIQRACQYLDLTNWCIQRVAEAIGIQDTSYFSRLFHKIVGLSPRSYRLHQKG